MTRSPTLFGVALLATIATAAAFVPASPTRGGTELGFKFLKDLGLEKPSWLPDFGDKKEKEPVAAAPAEEEGGETTEAEPEAAKDE